MIVCSCNIIKSAEIEEVILDLLKHDPWQVIVPLQVYRALEKRGKCCGCFSNVVDIIISQTKRYHAKMNSPEADVTALIDRVQRSHHLVAAGNDWVKALTVRSHAA